MSLFAAHVYSIWVTPDGRVIQCFETHADEVKEHPEEFGLSYSVGHLKAWQIHEVLMEQGYIRIGRMPSGFVTNFYMELFKEYIDDAWEFFTKHRTEIGDAKTVMVEVASPGGGKRKPQKLTVKQIIAGDIEKE